MHSQSFLQLKLKALKKSLFIKGLSLGNRFFFKLFYRKENFSKTNFPQLRTLMQKITMAMEQATIKN